MKTEVIDKNTIMFTMQIILDVDNRSADWLLNAMQDLYILVDKNSSDEYYVLDYYNDDHGENTPFFVSFLAYAFGDFIGDNDDIAVIENENYKKCADFIREICKLALRDYRFREYYRWLSDRDAEIQQAEDFFNKYTGKGE